MTKCKQKKNKKTKWTARQTGAYYVLGILQSRPKSSKRDDILNWLIYTGLVDNYIKKLEYADIPQETLEDEIQEVWLNICEIDQSKWDTLYIQGATAIKAYISGLIYRGIHSNSSRIYMKYKRPFNIFKHVSDETWDIYSETNIMQPTSYEYLTKETKDDTIKRYIEENRLDCLYEPETRKTEDTKNS